MGTALDSAQRVLESVQVTAGPVLVAAFTWLGHTLGVGGLATLSALALAVAVQVIASETFGAIITAIQRSADRRRRWRRTVQEETAFTRVLGDDAAYLHNPVTLISLALGLGLAIATVGDSPLFAIFILGVGAAMARYGLLRTRRSKSSSLARDIEQFLKVFLPIYRARIEAGPQRALREAMKDAGPSLQPRLREIVASIEIGQSPADVYAVQLRKTRHPFLSGLLIPLARAQQADEHVVLSSLTRLAARLHKRRRLQDRTRVSLAMLKWSLRFLQLAMAAAATFVLTNAGYRAWYFADLQHQAMLIALVLVPVAAAMYFDTHLSSLEERVL